MAVEEELAVVLLGEARLAHSRTVAAPDLAIGLEEGVEWVYKAADSMSANRTGDSAPALAYMLTCR